MVSNMLSPGLALRPLIKKGSLTIRSYLPEAMGVEEHLFYSLKDIDEFGPQPSSSSMRSRRAGAWDRTRLPSNT